MRSFPKSVLLFTSATSLCLKGVQRPLQLCKGGGRQTWRKGTRNSQVRKGNVRMMMNKAMGNSISLDEDERINMVCIIIHSSYEKALEELQQRPCLNSPLINLRQFIAGIFCAYHIQISNENLFKYLSTYEPVGIYKQLQFMSSLQRQTVRDFIWVVYDVAMILENRTGQQLLVKAEEKDNGNDLIKYGRQWGLVEHVLRRMKQGEVAANFAVYGWLEYVYRNEDGHVDRKNEDTKQEWMRAYWLEILTCLVIEMMSLIR